jgi:hypothetical protein
MGAMVDIRLGVSAEGPRGHSLESLWQWLLNEDALRGRIQQSHAAPTEGEMGAVSDVLVVAVGSGGALTALTTSLGLWLSQRRGRSGAATVELSRPDGTTIAISATKVADPAAAIREALSPWVADG